MGVLEELSAAEARGGAWSVGARGLQTAVKSSTTPRQHFA